jgi:hypothetical protein|tara:strand:- start:449 stop:622 length:174 start_codon:yes stop_codon:yes gene_type:complete
MRRNRELNIEESKELARRKYAERKIDRWVKWTWEQRGRVLYKELMNIRRQYKLDNNG